MHYLGYYGSFLWYIFVLKKGIFFKFTATFRQYSRNSENVLRWMIQNAVSTTIENLSFNKVA